MTRHLDLFLRTDLIWQKKPKKQTKKGTPKKPHKKTKNMGSQVCAVEMTNIFCLKQASSAFPKSCFEDYYCSLRY